MPDRDEELISRLRRGYEAFNRGDFDAALDMIHPEFEFARPGAQSAVRGAAAFREWMEPDAFEEQRIEPIDFRVNGNRVLVHQHATARGSGSGIELDVRSWAVWTMDDEGLALRLEGYQAREEAKALEAAGLSE